LKTWASTSVAETAFSGDSRRLETNGLLLRSRDRADIRIGERKQEAVHYLLFETVLASATSRR
jgi:hypothetical protein